MGVKTSYFTFSLTLDPFPMINIPSQWVDAHRTTRTTSTPVATVRISPSRSNTAGSFRKMAGNRGRQVRTSRQGPRVSLVDAGIAASWLGLVLAIVV